MDDHTLELLNSAPWPEISVKLLSFARARLASWPVTSRCSPEDFVQMAIEAVYKETRKWDPKRVPLEFHLMGIVRSMTSDHGVMGRREQTTLDRDVQVESLEVADGDGEKILDCDKEAAFQALKEAVADDRPLSDVVAALEMNAVSPPEIAEATGFDIKTVYELRRRLKPYIEQAAKRLRN